MASCQTTRWVSTAPYVRLTVIESTSDGDSAVLLWELQYISDSAANTSVNKSYSVVLDGTTVKSGTYNIDGKTGTNTIATGTKTISKGTSAKTVSFSVSFGFNLTWSGNYKGTLSASSSISVAKKASYTVAYNANGGSGAPASQTKWFGTTLKLSTTKPTRTGYSFQGWATSSGGSTAYASGANYTANAGVTLYAVWKANTYAVKYNANGGTGAPSSQTKTYGTTLKLSTTVPTKANYTFKGWATSASATKATYSAGASYTANSAVTLYAVWELAYVKPRIKGLTITRGTLVTNPSGATFEPSDEGDSALVVFGWACDKEVSSIEVEWKSALTGTASETISASGTSGAISRVVLANLDPEATYTFTVTVTDAVDHNSSVRTVAGTLIAIDFLPETKGGGVGKPAELEGVFDIRFQTRMLGGILHPILEAGTNIDEVRTPNTYVGRNITNYEYQGTLPPVTSGTFTLEVRGAGPDGQIHQIYKVCDKSNSLEYERYWYTNSWGAWAPVMTQRRLRNIFGTAYSLATTVTAGENYSSVSGDADLLGTNLRCYLNATRSTASNAGNVTNEVVGTFKINHGGKIKSAYTNAFSSGGTGPVATFVIANQVCDDTYLTFSVSIAATADAVTQTTTNFIVPVLIDVDAY